MTVGGVNSGYVDYMALQKSNQGGDSIAQAVQEAQKQPKQEPVQQKPEDEKARKDAAMATGVGSALDLMA